MTEEVVPQEGQEAPAEPQLSEVEQQALEHGWRPKEEFEAEEKNQGKKWRTAEDFMDRKSLFDKIDTQHKELRDQKKAINALMDHNKKIEQAAYDRAIKTLRDEKRQALAEQDLVRADEIGERIEEIKEEQRKAEAVAPAPQEEIHPQLLAWKQANPWYDTNPDLRAAADGIGLQLARQGMSPEAVLAEVTKRIRSLAPGEFRNPNKDRAVPTESASRKSSSSKEVALTADEERIMNTMIRAGVPITREEYAAQIKKARGY